MADTPIGAIVRLQVQRDPVKRDGVSYDPTPILSVDEAAIGPSGMVGRHGGAWVVDAHHAAHPARRGGGRRALSMGFTSHYAAMADRFGDAPLGCAGENVIVETGRRIDLDDLDGSVVVLAEQGEVVLGGARIASPCVEFTSYLLGLDRLAERAAIADHMTFLAGGTRGYILDVGGLAKPMRVRVGDEVVVRVGEQ